MQSQRTLKSVRAPFFIIGLLIALLWGAMFLNNSSDLSQATEIQDKGFFPMTLPTVLAPVIRKEVNKKDENESEKIYLSFKLPSLWQILNVNK